MGRALLLGSELKLTEADPGWLQLTGAAAEAVGRPLAEAHPELADLSAELALLAQSRGALVREGFTVEHAGLNLHFRLHKDGLEARCRVSEPLLRSEQREFFDLLSSMNEGFFTLSGDWVITSVNPRFVQGSGKLSHELLGHNFWTVFFPEPGERRSKFWSEYHRAMETRVAVTFEESYAPTGRWTQCRVFPRADGGLSIYYTDITERRQAEQKLRLEQDKLEALFAQAPALMALWQGPELVYERVNPAYQATFGDRQLVGKPLVEAVPELQGQPFEALIQGVLRTGEPFLAQAMLARLGEPPQDHYFNYSFTRVVDSSGEPYGVFNHAVDVTHHVEAGLRLAASEERLSRAVEVSGVGFYEWWPATDVFVVSEKMQHDWGLGPSNPRAEVVSRIHPDDLERHEQLVRECSARGESYHDEIRVVRPDGGSLWVEVQGRIEYDLSGQPFRLFGTVLNVTEQRRRRDELEAARQEAVRANDTKSAFLANMSHEIRTPLAAILGFTELLKDEGLGLAERRSFLETISRNGEALARLIDDILDLAKVEAGKLRLEEVDFSLLELVNEVLELFGERARSRGLTLTLRRSEEVGDRMASDPSRLRQILVNPVGNAIKFTDVGGVEVSLARAGELVEVWVRDSGVGISAEERSQLFTPFVQADNSSTRKHGGTGLGLALSRRLARALGGEVRLEADEGSGSTFVLSFRARPATSSQTAAASDEAVDLHGLSVLLVDDSADNRVFVQRMLQRAGAQVELAIDGSEAVERALAGSFDVVLMDWQMPVMDGLTATRALRSAGYAGRIVALTAHAMTEQRERTRAAGCDAHLTKPLVLREFFGVLSSFKR